MNVHCTYPLSLESPEIWVHYKPFVERFTETWRKFPPGYQCPLWVSCHHNMPDKETRSLFDGIPVQFVLYEGNGCDIGGALALAEHMPPESFQVSLTVHAYFHKSGWLAKMVESRVYWGPGIYAVAVSNEGGFHARTSCFGMDCKHLLLHTRVINRQECTDFEMNFAGRFSSLPLHLVSWGSGNGFRRGDQSGVLVKDRHCDEWEKASPEEKERLSKLCYEDPIQSGSLTLKS